MDPTKLESLQKAGCINRNAHKVTDALFAHNGFFDPHDVAQVKYEMVRRKDVDGWSVTKACAAFGFSRPSFYEIRDTLSKGGIAALIPMKRGPKNAHKLNEKTLAFIQECMKQDATLKPAQLAASVQESLGVRIHPRSIERALAKKKKRRTAEPSRAGNRSGRHEG